MSLADYYAALAAGGQNASAAASAAGDVNAGNATPAPPPHSATINAPTLDQYGRLTDGPYKGLTPEQAETNVSVALDNHGGYSFQPGDYRVNLSDGSITILKTPANGNYSNLTPGMKVDQSGNVFMPDGSPSINPTTGKPAQLMFGVNGQKTDTMKAAEAGTPALTNLLEGNYGDAITKTANDIKSGIGDLLNGGGGSGDIDTSVANAETTRANALADALGGKADTAGVQANQDRASGAQTRDQQEQSISDLQDAAAGRVASPAELQLKQQASIDAARQYGLAAALQGNNPTAALRQASLGAAQIAGTTNQNAGILRANETANARNTLATALGNVRSADQGAVNTDVNQQGAMTQGQLTSQGQGVTSTGQQLTAQTEKAKADALKEGSLIGAGGTLAASLLSDKRAKKDIVKASLADALGKNVHGVEFTYLPGEEDGDRHFGVLADDLAKAMPGVVSAGKDGMKRVHTGHLTLGNTAVLAELARRLEDLEESR